MKWKYRLSVFSSKVVKHHCSHSEKLRLVVNMILIAISRLSHSVVIGRMRACHVSYWLKIPHDALFKVIYHLINLEQYRYLANVSSPISHWPILPG